MVDGPRYNMTEKKKILFFGLGSIGMRHAGLLDEHFDVEMAAYRTGSSGNELNIKEFRTLDDAFGFRPDIAFITNPTDLHIEAATECARRSIHLFIEKPLSNRLEGIPALIELINKNNLINHVAFCMRFHPVIKYLKDEIDTADAFYSRTVCSSYLPAWRPSQDYTKSYSADSARGGGVINELIHELDYNEYLFGKVKTVHVNSGQISHLDISAKDFGEFMLHHENKQKSHVSLDFFSHMRERTVKIYYPDKVIMADVIKQSVKVFKDHNCIEEKNISDENMYLNQLKTYFDAFEGKKSEALCSVEESLNMVKLISEH
jgi:predicted dehydrogenase